MTQNNGDYKSEYDKFQKKSWWVTSLGIGAGYLANSIAKRKNNEAQSIVEMVYDNYNDVLKRYEERISRTGETMVEVVSLKKKILGSSFKKFCKSYRRLSSKIRVKKTTEFEELKRFFSFANLNKEALKDMRKEANTYLTFRQDRKEAQYTAFLLVKEDILDGIASGYSISKLDNLEQKKQLLDEYQIQKISRSAKRIVAALEYGTEGISNMFSAGRNIDEAKKIEAEIQKKITQIEVKGLLFDAIDSYAKIHVDVLKRMSWLMEDYVEITSAIIKSKENIFHIGKIKEKKFNDEEMEVLAFTMALVCAVRAVINAPILSSDGRAFKGNRKGFNDSKNSIGVYESRLIEFKKSFNLGSGIQQEKYKAVNKELQMKDKKDSNAGDIMRDNVGMPIENLDVNYLFTRDETLAIENVTNSFIEHISQPMKNQQVARSDCKENRLHQYFHGEQSVFIDDIRRGFQDSMDAKSLEALICYLQECVVIVDNSVTVRINGRLNGRAMEELTVFRGKQSDAVYAKDRIAMMMFRDLWKTNNSLADFEELRFAFKREVKYLFNRFKSAKDMELSISSCFSDIDNIVQSVNGLYKEYLDTTKRDYTGLNGIIKRYMSAPEGIQKTLKFVLQGRDIKGKDLCKYIEQTSNRRGHIWLDEFDTNVHNYDFRRVFKEVLIEYLVHVLETIGS